MHHHQSYMAARSGAFPALLLTAITASPVIWAQSQDTRQTLAITAENDIYAPRGQDRHYTNGVRIAWGTDQTGSWNGWLGRLLVGEPVAYELAFGQNLYTPEYYLAGHPIPEDRPYAGWLYGELTAVSVRDGHSDIAAVSLGIVGPAALGEPAQKLLHDLIGDPEPAGWDHQLRNEPALLLRYQRSWFVDLLTSGALHGDIVPGLGASLGNVFTDVSAGLTLRIGNQLPAQAVPLRIQPGLSGSPAPIPEGRQALYWMWFASAQGRLVVHNLFLDGNTFQDSLAVDKRPFVGDLATGIVLGFGQFDLPVTAAFTVIWRGREFDLQQGKDSFGSLTIGIHY